MACQRFLSLRSVVLPQSDAGRNDGNVKSCQRRLWLVGTALSLIGQPVLAERTAVGGLDWRYEPDAHQVAIWDLPPETESPLPENDAEDAAPVILPQPEFLDQTDTGPVRGWQWKEPSLGTGGQVAAYEEERTAVQIAESRQMDQMAERAEPTPGIDSLPGPLGDFNYRVDFGVEYRF